MDSKKGHATLQMTMDLYTHVLKEHSQEEMAKLEKVLDNTLDVSDATIHERFDKFQESYKEKDNIVYLSSVGTLESQESPGAKIGVKFKEIGVVTSKA